MGGRLENASEINYNQKYTIILPKNNHITNLVINNVHKRLFHAGQEHIFASLSQNYWIINEMREIKRNIHN